MSLLSIDIGSSRMHIAEGLFAKNSVHIERTVSVPMPEGCVSEGYVRDAVRLSQLLMQVLSQQQFRAKEAVVTIDAVDAVVRDIELPRASAKELDGMIRSELVQTYHIAQSDVVQYKAVEQLQSDSGAVLTRYRAAALDDELVDGYHTLLRMTKLKPAALDININAMSKLFSLAPSVNNRQPRGSASMYVDFGAANTNVYVNSEGNQQFFRHLKIGSGEIERMIASDTFTPVEDSLKKKEEGFNFFTAEGAAEKYFAILRPLFYGLVEELRKIMSFYVGRSGYNAVEQIYLFGGGSLLEGLPNYLENNLNVQVERLRSISAVNGGEPLAALPVCLNAAGALIRY